MKIYLVIFVAVVASAKRPPRGLHIDYSDSPPFYDSPPSSSRLTLLRPFSYRQSYPSVLQSFNDDTSTISDIPSLYRGEKIIYNSLPPSSYYPRRPHNFYKNGPSTFARELSITDEYRGPLPPTLNKDPRKQTLVTGDERPGASLLQLQTTMAHEQKSYKLEEQPIRSEIPTRQPLSYGGHSNHLSYGDHGLGFASVAGATSAYLDPVAIAEMSTVSMAITTSPSSPNEVHISQQQPVTNTPNPTKTPTLAESKVISTAIQPSSTSNIASSTSSPESTAASILTTAAMTSVTPKTHLNMVRNSPSQTTKAMSMMLQEFPRTSYDFGTVTQELPAVAHGQLPLESPRQKPLYVFGIKQNIFHKENKANFPYQQFDYQFYQHNNNNNAAPLRFTIPTATISTSPVSVATTTAAAAADLPMKPVIQGLSLPQTSLALVAVPRGNTYSIGLNHQIDTTQLGKSNLINEAPELPAWYYGQNTEQVKITPHISSNIPIASLFMLHSNVQPRQPVQINTDAPSISGIPFNFGGIELLASQSNAKAIRSDILRLGKADINIQEPIQSPEPTFARIGFGQNIWQN